MAQIFPCISYNMLLTSCLSNAAASAFVKSSSIFSDCLPAEKTRPPMVTASPATFAMSCIVN